MAIPSTNNRPQDPYQNDINNSNSMASADTKSNPEPVPAEPAATPGSTTEIPEDTTNKQTVDKVSQGPTLADTNQLMQSRIGNIANEAKPKQPPAQNPPDVDPNIALHNNNIKEGDTQIDTSQQTGITQPQPLAGESPKVTINNETTTQSEVQAKAQGMHETLPSKGLSGMTPAEMSPEATPNSSNPQTASNTSINTLEDVLTDENVQNQTDANTPQKQNGTGFFMRILTMLLIIAILIASGVLVYLLLGNT